MTTGRSLEELAEVVKQYIEKYPHTNRNKIKIATSIGNQKLQQLEDMGLIKLPERIKPGMNSKTWRFYKT